MSRTNKIDELFTTPCYVIDILPEQVPKDSPGQYFAFEEYYFENHRQRLFEDFADILLKLNCYYDMHVSFQEEWVVNPSPKMFYNQILACVTEKTYMNIMMEKENAMVIVNGEDLYLSVYNPNLKMQKLLSALAQAKGLFFRKSSEENLHDHIVSELFENRSVSAFVWLIGHGRELEFCYNGTHCFVTKSHSSSFVSLWIGQFEQAFPSVEVLWSDAMIDGCTLEEIWNKVKFETLF